MAGRRRAVGIAAGLGVSVVGVAMLTMEGDGQFEIGMALIPIGAIVALVIGFGRARKGADDNVDDDYHFDQERYSAVDDDDD